MRMAKEIKKGKYYKRWMRLCYSIIIGLIHRRKKKWPELEGWGKNGRRLEKERLTGGEGRMGAEEGLS